jgi:hypothetical protein
MSCACQLDQSDLAESSCSLGLKGDSIVPALSIAFVAVALSYARKDGIWDMGYGLWDRIRLNGTGRDEGWTDEIQRLLAGRWMIARPCLTW